MKPTSNPVKAERQGCKSQISARGGVPRGFNWSHNTKQKMPSRGRDPLFNMEEITKANPGADKTQLLAAVNNLMQTELSELGKRSVDERDSPLFKKTNAEASSSNLALETVNPCQALALTELTQESPMVDLTKSNGELSDTNADVTKSLM